jgi:hypothetical protein
VLLNALLLPANYIFGPFVIPQLLPHPLVPPAWSLATEFHFYLLLPLLFRWRALLLVLLPATLAVQLFGFVYESPTLNSDTLSYRYIFGVLPVFLMGYLYADGGTASRRIAFALWLLYVLLAACALAGVAIHQQRAREITLGATVALPLLALALASGRRAQPGGAEALGRAAGQPRLSRLHHALPRVLRGRAPHRHAGQRDGGLPDQRRGRVPRGLAGARTVAASRGAPAHRPAWIRLDEGRTAAARRAHALTRLRRRRRARTHRLPRRSPAARSRGTRPC